MQIMKASGKAIVSRLPGAHVGFLSVDMKYLCWHGWAMTTDKGD